MDEDDDGMDEGLILIFRKIIKVRASRGHMSSIVFIRKSTFIVKKEMVVLRTPFKYL